MIFNIITVFPRIFDSYFSESIIKRALALKLIDIKTHGLRAFAQNKHNKIDDRPYGGGAGMVLMAEPIARAVTSIKKKKKHKVIILSPKGRQLDQKMVYDWSLKYSQLILISGRYEGIDERVKKILRADEVSIGPYVMTDGDVGAMAIVSSVSRLIPGVLGSEESLAEESFSRAVKGEDCKLKIENCKFVTEYPHYTRPETFEYQGKKYRVPKVLLSGDHKKIEEWREEQRKTG